jgi:hypothetical protein
MTATWRNRIVGYSEEAPDQLLANPKNWRSHPATQADALRGVLNGVGVVQNVLANKRTGYLIDGHLRVMEALKSGQSSIPVTWVDLDEAEEATILATLDPLAALAGTDAAQLEALLHEVDTDSPALAAMLDALAQEAGIVPTLDMADAFGALPDGDRAPFQQMTFTLSDEQAERVKEALEAAKDAGPFDDTGNENSNGNALARIVEAYLGER